MKNSKIEWTHHTFNPWIGCSKVSAGCAHCYAETLNKRMGWVEWGDNGKRKRTSAANWKQPIIWNREAEKSGERARVFCASLADWLDWQAPNQWRADLLELIDATPWLDWLLLTKRPESWEARIMECAGLSRMASKWWRGEIPPNVWVGYSAENQEMLNERAGHAMKIPAAVRFISAEPLLGNLNFAGHVPADWVIVGGESGHGARPMQLEWARTIRDQCVYQGVPFLFKQWGGVNKKETGRELDGKEWLEYPKASARLSNVDLPRKVEEGHEAAARLQLEIDQNVQARKELDAAIEALARKRAGVEASEMEARKHLREVQTIPLNFDIP
jgi:protein gp37